MGIQSFDDEMLSRLGRIHGRTEALHAAESAHQAGFRNFNLDLMFGLPGQDLAQAEADINQAIALAPTHISYYQLTLEPNTAFAHQPPVLPDDDLRFEMQNRGQALLADAGYAQYEISAYAREGFRCRHNLNYWHFGDYLGIGAGAHGKITDPQTQTIRRRWKERHPREYLAKAATTRRIGGENQLTIDNVAFEFMMNALRLHEGFPVERYAAHTGLTIESVEKPLREAERLGLITWDLTQVRPTPQGLLFLNELLELFLS
jgi:oxygen-independent coproporphyrinogen-3 oxidase